MTKILEAEPILAFDPPRPGRRRVFTAEQKRLLLEEAERPGESMSSVARRYGIAGSLLFHWKRQRDSGAQKALEAGEPVVPGSEARLLQARVRELERQLGRKTMEAEILKEALEIARTKNGYCAATPRARAVERERAVACSRSFPFSPLGASRAEGDAREVA